MNVEYRRSEEKEIINQLMFECIASRVDRITLRQGMQIFTRRQSRWAVEMENISFRLVRRFASIVLRPMPSPLSPLDPLVWRAAASSDDNPDESFGIPSMTKRSTIGLLGKIFEFGVKRRQPGILCKKWTQNHKRG
jgi:hypothetical protein